MRAIEWFATPKYERTPPNVVMLGQEIGFDDGTIYRWAKKPAFREEVHKLVRESLGNKLPELYATLIREAEAGSFQHLQMAFEMMGEYTRTQKNMNENSGEVRLIFERAGLSSVPEHLAPRAIEGNTREAEI